MIGVSLGSMGFAHAIYYYLSSDTSLQEKYNHVNATRIIIVFSAMVSIGIGLLLFPVFDTNFGNPLLSNYILIACLLIFTQIIQSVEQNILLSIGKMKRYLFSMIGALALRILFFVFYILNEGQDLTSYLWILLASLILPVLINQLSIQQYFKGHAFYFNRKLIVKHLQYALPIGLGMLFGVLMGNTDRLVYSYFFKDSEAFAILSNGNFEIPIITTFYISFSTLAFPAMQKAFAENNIKELLVHRYRYIKEIALILFPIVCVLIFWAEPIITLLFGKQYVQSASLFSIYAFTFFVRFASHNDIFLASGKTHYISIIQGVELVFNLLICIVCVYYWGLTGASLACVITNLAYVTASTYLSAGILKIPGRKVFPTTYLFKILAIAGIGILIPFLLENYFHTFFSRSYYTHILSMGIYLLTYVLMIYTLKRKGIL